MARLASPNVVENQRIRDENQGFQAKIKIFR